MLRLSMIASMISATLADDASFLALGDWGAETGSSKMMQELHGNAAGMAKFAEQNPEVKFVLALGDNFYDYGVVSATDNQSNSNWKGSWLDVFNSHGPILAALPWYAVLGNHGYGFNPQAQVDATKTYPGKWIMPARNYINRVKLSENATRYVSFIFFDSTPCITPYRSDNHSKWDPQPPSSRASDWNKKHYNFSENLKAEPCQSAVLEKLLAQTESSDWKIMIAHHRADEPNFDLNSLLAKYEVDLYLNGHLHSLEAYTWEGTKTKFLTIGSGCVLAAKAGMTPEEKERYLAKARNHNIAYQFHADSNGFGGFFFQDNYSTLQAHIYTSDFTSVHELTLSK